MKYVALLRGINVGGKNKISMAQLKQCLEKGGYLNVRTYINSGNILVESKLTAKRVESEIEEIISRNFNLDSSVIKVLVLSNRQLRIIVDKKPKGFGDNPNVYHSDVVFLINIKPADAIKVFNPKEEVDTIWQGTEVIYSQRLSALRTKSRLNQIVGTPAYKAMTIRNWNTTIKLLELAEAK